MIAVLAVLVALAGVVLSLTVFNTDESENGPNSGTTGPTATTGETGSTLDYVQVVPQPIEGPLLGVNLTAYTADGYAQPSVHQAIQQLVGLGTTAITLVPTWYMRSPQANRIQPDASKTPTDESLSKVIGWAKAAGLSVILKPHVDVLDDSYRGEIQPSDRQVWFRSYDRFIDHFASYAASKQIDLFVAGTELKTMSGDTEPWRTVIQTIRSRYTGPVTYAANWDEVDQVQFWDDLDAIGVDAYYPLSEEGGPTPTAAGLVSAWKSVADQLRAKSEQWQRPVLITEVGYPSQVGATAKPYEVTDQPPDQAIQAMAYRATFDALSGSDWLKGISWWSWRADPSPEEKLDVDYSPEGKRAQGELARGQWLFQG